MFPLHLILMPALTHAGWVFPTNYPPNEAAEIASIRDSYLKNIQPVLARNIHTAEGDWDELAVHGAAAGLVLGLELNHRRLSPSNRRLTLNAVGLLLLRAVSDRVGLGEPVPDELTSFRGVRLRRFRLTDDDRVRRDFEKLLGHTPISPVSKYSAAGLINRIAEGRFLPALKTDAEFFRAETAELLFHALDRQPPFQFVEFSYDEAQGLVLLLRELRTPRLLEHLEALRNQETIVRKFAEEVYSCECRLARRGRI